MRLAAERSPADIRMVDTSEWGGEQLRKQYGTAQKALAAELIVFRQGQPPAVYNGKRDANSVFEHMRALGRGRPPPRADKRRPADAPDDEETDWFDDHPTDGVVPLSTANLNEALTSFPLVFVLFYSTERSNADFLHSNFSAAALALHEQRIPVRLAKVRVHAPFFSLSHGPSS